MTDRQSSEEYVKPRSGKGKGFMGTSFLPIPISSDESICQTRMEEDSDSYDSDIPLAQIISNAYGNGSSGSKRTMTPKEKEVRTNPEEYIQEQEYYSATQDPYLIYTRGKEVTEEMEMEEEEKTIKKESKIKKLVIRWKK